MDQAAAILAQIKQWADPYLALMAEGAWTHPVDVPLWLATGAAALLALLLLGWVFGNRSGEGGSGGLFRLVLVVVAAIVAWKGFGLVEDNRRAAARAALEERIARAIAAPVEGNPLLACAAGVANLDLRQACERTVFAKPENAAAAVSLVKDRLELLAAISDTATGLGRDDARTVRLRRMLETDDFGVVAHVLMEADGCRPEACAGFELFREPEKIRANMVAKTFEGLVEKHAAAWNPAAGGSARAAASPPAGEPETPPTATPGSIWAVPAPSEPAPAEPAATPPPAVQPVAPRPQPPAAARPPAQPPATAPRPAAAAPPTAPRQPASPGASGQSGSAQTSSSAPVVRGLPPPQSLAPPPGTPPAPGVPPRSF